MAERRRPIRVFVVLFGVVSAGFVVAAALTAEWPTVLGAVCVFVSWLGWGHTLAVHNPRMVDRFDSESSRPD